MGKNKRKYYIYDARKHSRGIRGRGTNKGELLKLARELNKRARATDRSVVNPYQVAEVRAELKKITVRFFCPGCERVVSAAVTEHDFSFGEHACDLCGSHGNLDVDVKCPKCGGTHEINLRGW